MPATGSGHRLLLDLETYSRADLRTVTPYRYAADREFQILMAAWSVDGVAVNVAVGEDQIRRIPGLGDPTVTHVAFNAAFERVCLSQLFGLPVGEYLPPDNWFDPQAAAAELGYPQQLGKLAKALGAEAKDSAGTRLINLFAKPNRRGERNLPEDHPVEWLDFVAYCEQDLQTLIDVDRRLSWTTRTEREVYLTDQRINDRGLRIDLTLAGKAVLAAEENRMVQELEISALTDVANPGSVPQLLKWLQGSGLTITNLQAKTVAMLLASGSLSTRERRVLELRAELALTAPKKFSAALSAVSSDGRLRGSFKFFGAHTGRWSGRGTQPHNLPRAQLTSEAATDAAILDLELGAGGNTTTLKTLVRAMFVGPFVVVDYAAIEARVVAWLANERWALAAFHAGRDIYTETADRMGGMTRSQGKVAVLALGFNGSTGSLRAMGYGGTARTGDTPATLRWDDGEDPSGTVTTAREEAENEYKSDDELLALVRQWRQANPSIVRLWRMMNVGFREGGSVGRYLFVERDRSDRYLRLPSGRVIGYHGCKFDERLSFWDSRRGHRVDTYGGRLVENVTQAVARDVLAEALVRLETAGYAVVGHVHDEVIVEAPASDLDAVLKIVTEPPPWAAGLPIDGEAFAAKRYRKG